MTASHGSAISAANRPNARPLAANASRLVRLETGSSSEPELARCAQAYTCGLARTPSVTEVANTTGVSRTTVVSRLSTAVVTAAVRNTSASSLRGRAADARASQPPTARNSPSSSHRCASSKMATRNPVPPGASRPATSAAASPVVIAPVATRMTAAGPATTASWPASRPPHCPRQHREHGEHRNRLAEASVQSGPPSVTRGKIPSGLRPAKSSLSRIGPNIPSRTRRRLRRGRRIHRD